MSNYGPRDFFIVANGIDLSPHHTTASEETEGVLEECRPFGVDAPFSRSRPVGIAKAVLSASGGVWDDASASMIAAFQGQGAVQQIIAYGLAGDAIKQRAVSVYGAFASKWKRITAKDALTKANAEFSLTGRVWNGRVLHGTDAVTAATKNSGWVAAEKVDRADDELIEHVIASSSVANPSIISLPVGVEHGLETGDVIIIAGHSGSTPSINGEHQITKVDAATFSIAVNVSAGGTGGTYRVVTSHGCQIDTHLLRLTLDGATGFTRYVFHSHDGTSWTSLGTPPAVTVGANRETILPTTIVRRYLAFGWAFGGSGGANKSATPLVIVARD
jgi:hypothetical protein